MHDGATAAAPGKTGDLIDRIPPDYHAMHRADLAFPVPLAEGVEQVHADDPEAPGGLAPALTTLKREMEDHMAREETILLPATRAGGGTGIGHTIAEVRGDHDDHAETIAPIRKLTCGLTQPEYACGPWRSLCGGTATWLDGPSDHFALKNNMLFARFKAAA